MKILVTGASGFVGSRTSALLETAGHEVIRVCHTARTGMPNEFALDIAARAEFQEIEKIPDIDAVVHCAGIAHRFGPTSKAEFWRVNVEGARNVAEFAARKKVARFVHLSSVLVYGPSRSKLPITEDQNPVPSDNYSSSKLAGEIEVEQVCDASGMQLTILRPVPVIGEGSRGNIARLIRAIDRGRFLWIGDGRNKRSFIYVDDVAAAVLASLFRQGGHARFNVTGEIICVMQMVKDIADHLNKPRPHRLIPYKAAKVSMSLFTPFAKLPKLGSFYRTLETFLADAVYSGEALEELGFRPSTDIREGLRREVQFYLDSK